MLPHPKIKKPRTKKKNPSFKYIKINNFTTSEAKKSFFTAKFCTLIYV